MPVITFKYQDLKDLGIDMEKDELINTIPMMAVTLKILMMKKLKLNSSQTVQITYLLKVLQDHLKDF